MSELIEVKVGQIWVDNDPRHIGPEHRRLKVLEVSDETAYCLNLNTQKKTRINIKRFKPTSNGYRLESKAR